MLRILREEALSALNDSGQSLTPADILPDDGRYKNCIKPLYAAWLICYIDRKPPICGDI